MSRTASFLALAVLIAAAIIGATRLRRTARVVADGDVGTRPSVLLVTLDTERADHTSTFGYSRPTTPSLDALAARGIVFTSAYTAIPSTGPSHAGLLTSHYPSEHGVLKNGDVLHATTVTEVLARAGYVTAAFVSAYPLARKFGFARGFATFDDEFRPGEASIVISDWEGQRVDSPAFDRRADATTARALRWLSSAPRDRPFFLWVHYYDPHEPYDPPPAYRHLLGPVAGSGRFQIERDVAAYDGEIRFADDGLGRLIAAVDERVGGRPTIVVVASDHGEGLMQHGWMGHGAHLYEELVHTVLVIRWSGAAVALRCGAPVGLIDVAPTLLALLGVDAGDLHARGVDLGPALRGGPGPPAKRPLFFQRRVYQADRTDIPVRGDMRAVRIGTWKYIESSTAPPELFELGSDPGEVRNRWQGEHAHGLELAAVLAAWRGEVEHGAPADQPLSRDEERRMRQLGYVE